MKESQEKKKSKKQKLSPKELMSKIQILSRQREVLMKELSDCKQRNKYQLADLDNYKKHIDRQFELMKERANESLLKDVINVVDDLERAIGSMKNSDDSKGIKMIYNNLMKLLNKYGVKKIECLGKLFDPKYHEALLQEESDKEDGTILEELQAGYLHKDTVLRYSKVKVAKHVDKK